MERSPFPHHGPLEPEQVFGRERLAIDLAQRIADRRLTALLGPRRYGKTSLLKRVAADLAAVGQQPVWIDLYERTSIADVAAAVDRGLAGAVGPVRKMLDDIAGTFSVNLGVLGVQLSRSPKQRPDPVLTLRTLLDILTTAAQRRSLFVVFDEFCGIANVEGGAAVLRTELQHHFQELGIVFAGSEPSTMQALFSEHTQPFFAQADLVEIEPLTDDAVVHIIEAGFERTGRATGSITSRIAQFADGHPQRAMQLADALWRQVDSGGTANLQAWEAALADVRAHVDSGSERIFSLLPGGQQKTLRAIAAEGTIYGTAASLLDLPAGTARSAADKLVGNGILHRRNAQFALVDPLLADWLRCRFAV